jgi:DNA-binding transcriptional ArsR family regulator
MRNQTVTDPDIAFAALADPTRRALLELLRTQGSQPVGQMAESFPVARPAISKHLRLLRRARLVREQRRGRHRYYELDAAPLKAVDGWLEAYRDFWRSKLHHLKAWVEAENPPEPRRKKKPRLETRR